MSISIEDYENYYTLFEAENSLYSNLSSINEDLDFNTKITEYLNKVISSTQKSWDKFKQTVATEKNKKFLQDNSKALLSKNIKPFKVEKYIFYNLSPFNELKIIDFNYGLLKDSLKNKEEYLKKYYSRFVSDDEKSLKKSIEKAVKAKEQDLMCTSTEINNFYKFCTQGFYNYRSIIEQNLDKINRSVQNITRNINTIISQESVLLEAPLNNSNNKEKLSNNNDKTFFKDIVLYMKINTEILSVEMKLLSQIYKEYYELLVQTVKSAQNNPNQNIQKQIKI